MRAISSFLVVVSTLGAIGWLNSAPAREVGLDALARIIHGGVDFLEVSGD